MNINRVTNRYISVEDKYFIICNESIKDGMVRVHAVSSQDDIVFNRGYDSISYVRLDRNYEDDFRSGNKVPIKYIKNITKRVTVFNEPFTKLTKGIRNRIDVGEYIYYNEINRKWNNIITVLGYINGCDRDTLKHIGISVNKIVATGNEELCKKLSRRLILTDPYVAMTIFENRRFKKYLLRHIREYVFLKRHCDCFYITIFDLIKAIFE